MKRRLEVRAEIGGVTIIEDFAHHPTAIRETLRTLRSVYPGARLWAVLEPRSNTLRRKVLEGEIVESLRLADRVVLALLDLVRLELVDVDDVGMTAWLGHAAVIDRLPDHATTPAPATSAAVATLPATAGSRSYSAPSSRLPAHHAPP